MPIKYWVIGIIIIVLGAIFKHRWYSELEPFDTLPPDKKKARLTLAVVGGVLTVGCFLLATWKFFHQ